MTQKPIQLDLFAPEPAQPPTTPGRLGNAKATSHAAYASMKPNLGATQRRILGHLVAMAETGGTDSEIQLALGLSGDSQRPRRKELQRAGLVEDSGQVRQTPAGRLAVVWKATAAAFMESSPMPVFPADRTE